MSIKRRESPGGAPPVTPGPCVVVSVNPITAIRFELAGRTVCCPLSGLARWEWSNVEEEKLVIDLAKDRVTVTGHGLATVLDALDAGRLQVLREVPPTRIPAPEGQPRIDGIKIESR